MNRVPTDIYVVVDGPERDLVGPMTEPQAGAYLSCLDRYRPDLAGHAVCALALPEGADPARIEAFRVHPALLERTR